MKEAVLIVVGVIGIKALVEAFKKFSWWTVLSLVLGVGLNLLAWSTGELYVGYSWFAVASLGLLYGLAASGVYDMTKVPVVEVGAIRERPAPAVQPVHVEVPDEAVKKIVKKAVDEALGASQRTAGRAKPGIN